MMEQMGNEVAYMTHCCLCGYRLGKSAPGSKVYMTCPKCGSELEIQVENSAVHVILLKTKRKRNSEVMI